MSRFLCAVCAALVVSLCLVPPVRAKFLSAENLLQELDSAECTRNSLARGYILGVYDSFEGTLYPQHEALSPDQLVLLVEQSLRENREYGVYSAQTAVMRALEEHFRKLKQTQDAGQEQGGDPLAGKVAR